MSTPGRYTVEHALAEHNAAWEKNLASIDTPIVYAQVKACPCVICEPEEDSCND